MSISKEIFELYEFISSEEVEIHCYKDLWEMEVFIPPYLASDFLTMVRENLDDCLCDDGIIVNIVNYGNLCVELISIIEHYCHEDEVKYWFDKFENLEED